MLRTLTLSQGAVLWAALLALWSLTIHPLQLVSQTHPQATDSLLLVLETHMSKRTQYDAERQNRIHLLHQQIATEHLSNTRLYEMYLQLYREYEAYQFDSALHYLHLNLQLSQELRDSVRIYQTRLQLIGMLVRSGALKDADDLLHKLPASSQLPQHLRAMYYTYCRKLHSELSFYSPAREVWPIYRQQTLAYTDSLLALFDSDSEPYLAIQEARYLDMRQIDEALAISNRRLAIARMATRQYSLVTFERSLLYEVRGQVNMQKYNLALSAISDIRAAIKDNASLTVLATLLYREGKLEQAHRFISFALDDAAFFNSRLRFSEIANILPVINAAHEKASNAQNTRLRRMLYVISVLGLVLLVALAYIAQQIRRLSQARNALEEANGRLQSLNENLQQMNGQLQTLNHQLWDANLVKEHYIGHFLSICSDYIDKLDAYRKMVNKQIAARKVQQLFEATRSQDFLKTELDAFYHNFDETFLKIYPDFVAQFNKLLLPESQITLRSGELLTTELRIFALIRLGITDSSQIARLLRYSVNTIYNYRAKLKGKAMVPRGEFEQHVCQISQALGSENALHTEA